MEIRTISQQYIRCSWLISPSLYKKFWWVSSNTDEWAVTWKIVLLVLFVNLESISALKYLKNSDCLKRWSSMYNVSYNESYMTFVIGSCLFLKKNKNEDSSMMSVQTWKRNWLNYWKKMLLSPCLWYLHLGRRKNFSSEQKTAIVHAKGTLRKDETNKLNEVLWSWDIFGHKNN